MARPMALEIPPRDRADELGVRVESAPVEHAEALLAGYEVLQALHEQGVLEILRGALGARDQLLETIVDAVDNPDGVRAIRNLLILSRMLGAIEPDVLSGLVQAVPEGFAEAASERSRPVGLWVLLRRIRSKDSLRAMAAVVGVLEAFGRNLRLGEDAARS